MTVRYTISGRERREIRSALHAERPVVQVGKAGLDEAVLRAAEEAISVREAIKVSIGKSCPEPAAAAAESLAVSLSAELIARTGRVVLLYRPAPEEQKA